MVPEDSSDSHSISELQYDIGQHYLNVQSLSDEEKYNLLLNCSKLSSDFQCPFNTHGRKFLHSWLIDFPWLSYSKGLDGAFYICLLRWKIATILQSLLICGNPLSRIGPMGQIGFVHPAKNHLCIGLPLS